MSSYQLCKELNEFLTMSSAISLHHTLLSNSLLLNPNSLIVPDNPNLAPPSSASMLSTVRERLTRFRNFVSKSTNDIEFRENEGNLYEYLEGLLIRGVNPVVVGNRLVSKELAIYDLRKLAEWEDDPDADPADAEVAEEEDVEETTESEAGKDIRTAKRFDYEISEFAVDPGQDLLVIVEIR